jgi:hypothetical protein
MDFRKARWAAQPLLFAGPSCATFRNTENPQKGLQPDLKTLRLDQILRCSWFRYHCHVAGFKFY